jgi:hypothetical protein
MSTAFRSYVTLSIMLSLYGKQINVAEDTRTSIYIAPLRTTRSCAVSEDSSSCGCASLNRGNSKILAEDYVSPLETLPSPVKAEMVFIPGKLEAQERMSHFVYTCVCTRIRGWL